MTLLEILLTLSLLVILASLTWPALGRPMASQRLREAADQVRAEWVRARVRAMSSGETHVFRYTSNADGYTIEAYASEDDALSELASQPDAAADRNVEDPNSSHALHHRLPEKVRFAAGQAVQRSTGQPVLDQQSPASADSNAQPLYFYVDGTCSDARVWLENEYGRRICLSLRGITGVVTLSDAQAAEGGRP